VLNRYTGLERKKQSNPVNKDPNIDLHPPTWAEIKIALKQMKSGKAPGLDNITLEVLKVYVETLIDLLYPMSVKIWMKEILPADWKKGMIVKLPKKGDTTNCNNWRGITLLSVPSKVFSRIILNCIKDPIEMRLRKEQAGFRRHHSCANLINTLQNILEQGKEWQNTLYPMFIDFEKAFDSINRKVMWQTLVEYQLPTKIINIIK
jgi:hypothetical protein